MKKTLITTLIFVFGTSAFAGSIEMPDAQKDLCFKKVYTPEHLAKHKKQIFTAVWVQVKFNSQDDWSAYSAQIIAKDRKGVAYSTAESFTFDTIFTKSGQLRFGVDCDGGAFTLDRKDNILAVLKVDADYYTGFYVGLPKPHSCELEEEEEQAYDLQIDAKDKENAIYVVYPVSAEECKNAIEGLTK